jgi:Ran GTPase-activating protein 1
MFPLCEALEDKQSLTELDFSHNAFGPRVLESFSKLLKSNHNIKSLKVINNGLGITGGTIIADALQVESTNQTLPSITRFEAGRNRLENPGATNLAQAFKKIGSLTALHLPQNGIRSEGISALADAISVNAANFTELNLSDNTLKTEGATAIAKSIKQMKKLKHLNLGDCLLTPEGGIAIAEAIKDSEHLEHLDLVYNELDDDAAFAIIKAIENKKNLKRVELNGNEFSGKALAALRKALEDKDDVLGTLSDNEGDDDDDEDDDEEDDE